MNDDLKLREEVATRIMGWFVEGVPGGVYRAYQNPCQHRASEFCATAEGVWNFVPKYERDIAAAWEVVEKMRERGYSVSISLTPDLSSCPSGVYFLQGVTLPTSAGASDGACRIVESDEDGPWARTPRAICLAALAAVGGI